MTKTVAFVANSSWALFNYRLKLMSLLRSLGFKVIAVAPLDEYSQRLIDEGFEHFPIPMKGDSVNPVNELASFVGLLTAYRQLKPDFALQFSIKPNVYGSLIAPFFGIKCINNIAGLGTLFEKRNFKYFVGKFLYLISQRFSKWVFFQNNEDHHLFVSNYLVSKHTCSILPGSGVDLERFKPCNFEKKDSGKLKFLLLGRMLWSKGIQEFVDAAAIIKEDFPNIEFSLLGFMDCENPSAVPQAKIDEWEHSGLVQYLGVSDDVQSIISQYDCVVLPSYYREGTPRSLLESAAMSKPIITTDNVGCRDVVDDGQNGFICAIQSSKDLVRAMLAFIELSPNQRRKMGEMSRLKMEREYSEQIIFDKYLDVINHFD